MKWALQRFFIALGVIAVFNGAFARAQQTAASDGHTAAPVAWRHDLEAAKKEAAETGKLVLVHFAAAWCGPCHHFDAEVLSRPEVAAALHDNYVAVRFDADQNPGIARSMGITRLPTDIVLNASGQEVARFATNEQRREVATAGAFLGEIKRIAAAGRTPPLAMLAQRETMPGARSASSPNTQATTPDTQATMGPSAQAAAASGARSPAGPGAQTDPRTQSGPPPADHPYTAIGQPYGGPYAQATTDNAPYGSLQHNVPNAGEAASQHENQTTSGTNPANGASNDKNSLGNPPVTSGTTTRTMSRFSSYSSGDSPWVSPYGPVAGSAGATVGAGHDAAHDSNQRAAQNPGQVAAQNMAQNTIDISQNAMAGPTHQTPLAAGRYTPGANQQMPDAAQRALTGPGPSMSPADVASQNHMMPAPNQNAPNANAIPTNNPPLGLDGYCPVTLKTESRWVAGDRRWGAIHQGRTYLFVGPQQQQQFLANPNDYSPVLAGADAVVAVDTGQHVAGYRRHGVVYDNRIFLFANEASLQKFTQNPERYAQGVRQAQRIVADRTAPR